MNEMLLSIKRAGAKVILTYFAKDFSKQKFWFDFWMKLKALINSGLFFWRKSTLNDFRFLYKNKLVG
jgi:hypothetical protein